MFIQTALMETDELVKKLTSKDLSAFEFLYDLYASTLYKIIKLATPDNDLANQILHDVFMQIYQDIEAYQKSKQSLLIWMIRITINHTKDTLELSRQKCLEVYRSEYTGLLPTLINDKDQLLAD